MSNKDSKAVERKLYVLEKNIKKQENFIERWNQVIDVLQGDNPVINCEKAIAMIQERINAVQDVLAANQQELIKLQAEKLVSMQAYI